jgi:hypothetical protein
MTNDKWVERWAVRSSSGHGDYIIGRGADGKYGCSCMGWCTHVYCPHCGHQIKKLEEKCSWCGTDKSQAIRHDCTHILEVKTGHGRSIGEATLDRMLGR